MSFLQGKSLGVFNPDYAFEKNELKKNLGLNNFTMLLGHSMS